MANNFTVVGSPTFSVGKYGNALTPSSGNYLTFADASAFRSSTGLTVEYWMKTTSTGDFLGVFSRAGNEWFGITGGKLFCPSTWIIDVTVSDGAWHHVAWTFNGTTVRCFLDGTQAASVANTANSQFWPASGAGSALFIGARSDNPDGTGVTGFFPGQIDDLRISKTVRYTGNFTPPANTHTGDANTLGLYRLESNGADSAADLTPPAGSPIPGPPTNVVATPGTGQVALTWTAGTDDVAVTGYRIYRRGGLIATTASTSFTETGLPGGVRYEYRLESVDADGNVSAQTAVVAATTPLSLKAGAPTVILDQDLSSDIDDIGAIATLHALADLGECAIVGMAASSTNGGTSEAMDVINTYYGRPDIPVGVRTGTTGPGGYPGTLASEFSHDLSYSTAASAVTMYRTVLAAAANASITIITTGYLTNVAALLDSTADGISALTGMQLVTQKVKTLVCMGGVYPSGNEFNFMSAGDGGAAAFRVVNDWPTQAVYSGFEIGSPIYTGGESLFTQTPTTNPIRRAWEVFHDPTARASFDQTAVYAACRLAEGLFGANTTGRNTAASNGSNAWVNSPDPSGATEQQYLLERVRYPVQQAIDTLICATPAAAGPGAPTRPTNLRTTSVTSSSIVLAWTSNSFNESGFAIERRDNTTGAYAQIGTVSAGITTYTDSGLVSTANRAYRVRATSSRGNSPYATLSVFSGWTESNFTTPANTPIYTVVGNHLRYGRALLEDHVAVNNDSTHGTTVTVTTDVGTVGAGGSSLIYFLYQDANNWYRINVTDTASKFEKRVGGVTTQLGSAGAGIALGPGTQMQPWQLALTPSGMTFTAPAVTVTATDTLAFSSGKIGFGALSRGPLWQNITIASTAAVATPTLSNTAVPVISGIAQTGQTLTASAGSWSATPDGFGYQWSRGATSIAGATGSAYTVQTADVGQQLTVTVTATKAGYTSASATSASVIPAAPGGTPSPLANTAVPTISGTLQQGQILTAGVGSWNVTPDSFGYQWRRGGVDLAGATGSTYLLVSADIGATITVAVTAAKVGYTSATATSAATATITAGSTAATWMYVNRGGTAVSVGGGGAAGIPATVVTAKGDLPVATGPSTVTRLPVGGNGQVLKADSSTPTGLAWGTDAVGQASSGSGPSWPATVYADNPPAGLTAVTFNNSTDDAPALQALLNYVKSTFGGGRVVLSKPGSVGVRILSGLVIPAKVQLVSDEWTLINASGMNSGTAITVNDSDFTPLVGIRLDGGLFTPTTANLTSTYTGISVTGVNLKFEKLHLQYFGRGIDIARSNTFLLAFTDCGIGRCAVGLYADIEAAAASNSGESIVFARGVIANSVRGFQASANGLNLRFKDASLDFCTELGTNNNGRIFIDGHLEVGGVDAGAYLFDLTGNGILKISNTEIVMGGGRSGGLQQICRADRGPANYGFGAVRIKNTTCFFVDPTNTGDSRHSEDLIPWETGITTKTFYVPWPLRWVQVTAQFCATDGAVPPNADTIRVSAMNTTTNQITLTSSASFAGQRWVRVNYG